MSEAKSPRIHHDSSRNITITVLYFAAALTATGIASETIELPIPTHSTETNASSPISATPSETETETLGFPLSALADVLSQRHPGTNLDKILRTSQWSVDAEMVDDPENVLIRGGEEVAVICPVSGG